MQLSPLELEQLAIIAKGTYRERLKLRAEILLRLNEGQTISAISQRLGCSRSTIYVCMKRYREKADLEGPDAIKYFVDKLKNANVVFDAQSKPSIFLARLTDRPRPGRPASAGNIVRELCRPIKITAKDNRTISRLISEILEERDIRVSNRTIRRVVEGLRIMWLAESMKEIERSMREFEDKERKFS